MPERIPAELRELPQWVNWQYKCRDGKYTKVPLRSDNLGAASSTDSATWTTFDAALARYEQRNVDGIGFVFTSEDSFVGIDLDKCIDVEAGEVKPWAREILEEQETYAETSPSGTGIKLIARGTLSGPGNKRQYEDGAIEMYEKSRFFTITGDAFPGYTSIADNPATVTALHAKMFPKAPPPPPRPAPPSPGYSSATDADILDKARAAKNGDKFNRLWSGDTTEHGGDESVADLALCGMLSFWTGPDHNRIDGLFRQSGLMRPKWDRADYRKRTIDQALSGGREYYEWNRVRFSMGSATPGASGTNDAPAADSSTSAATPPKKTFGYSWEPIDSAPFFAADLRPQWLVENMIVERQPLILGGPQKVLKTSVVIDIAISLASATPVLGYFLVRDARKVAILSGESGPFALQSIAKRICKAKGIEPASLAGRLSWQCRLPQLAVQEQLEALAAGLNRDKPDVIIIDPLYLSLLAGSDARAENMFDMGPLLQRIAQICDEAGCTPILLHHAPKPVSRKTEPMELTDLAFSGIAEFARQWILISRREPYEPGSGLHQLWMVVGGSVGHNGLFALDIEEGQLGIDFGGRTWGVSVSTGTEAKKEERDEKESAKREAALKRDGADDLAVMGIIDREGKGEFVSYTRVRQLSTLNNERMTRSVDRLKRTGLLIEEPECKVASGNGAMKKARGLRRKGERQNVGTNDENPDVPTLTNVGTGLSVSLETVPSPIVTGGVTVESEDGKAVPTLDAGSALFKDPVTGVYGERF